MSVGIEGFLEFIEKSEHTSRVRICAEFTIKDGQVNAFRVEMQRAIDKAMKEKGCKQYELVTDHKSPVTLWLLEDWETKADLKAHWEEGVASGIPNITDMLDDSKISLMTG